ncbi:hypothetical protein K8Z61_18640 [Nocardioides sp. TRM66260-LWL]|uniref:hypothetical protein n=1 Tax=Nocardioides sp. TRM66260-LWL TaxID=2874478 RepID=UPI001CC6AD65|nr:hypothetical protein [Nocardioides sp. TRM66260-LWL]MBZ5736514.1 hypothetical protein [Nocardioides sp. TRM66260-LWL]
MPRITLIVEPDDDSGGWWICNVAGPTPIDLQSHAAETQAEGQAWCVERAVAMAAGRPVVVEWRPDERFGAMVADVSI